MKTRKNLDRNYRYLPLATLFILLGMVFFACKEDKPAVPGSTNVMAVHASPDATATNFYLAGTKINTEALAYGQSSGYISTPAGPRKAEFKGSDNHNLLASKDLDLAEQKNYTVFFAGPVASPDLILIQDDLSAPAAGKAKVRVINLSPDNTAVDIRLKGGNKLSTNMAYKSVSGFLDADPGAVTYEVLKNADESLIYTMPEFNLQAGKLYTIWFKGSANGVGNAAYGAKLIANN